MGTNQLFNTVMVCAIVLFIAVALAGCALKASPAPGKDMQSELKGAPDWVVKGCSTYWKAAAERRMICGVGAYDGKRNPTMAREIAIGRARADIAKKIQVAVTSTLKDYQATTTGGEGYGTIAADEQYIESISKEITDMNLTGTEMVDSWISENGTFYVLVAMDSEKFVGNINKMTNLPGELRNSIINRSEKILQE